MSERSRNPQPPRLPQQRTARLAPAALLASAALCALALASCGGGSDPFGNPASVQNPAVVTGQRLSFAYFQRCINPIFTTQLQAISGGGTNSCAGSGCHADATGTGGALRIVPSAQPVDLNNPANTPAVIRATDIYKNFYSAQGEVVIGVPTQSRLLQKPLLLNVLHGGGQILSGLNDPNAKLIQYWITHPAPTGEDEFSTATYVMFTPPDPMAGTCNTQ
jgi:hypothetical protein